MFSNLIDTRYHTDYRLMASSWMRNIWESHLLQINKSSEKLKKMSTESERARRFAQKISHIGLTNTLHAFPTALALIHGRYRCREASAARDTLTGEIRRSQGARESFYDLFRDLHNHDKERDARRRSFGLHSISYWFDRRCRETTSRLTKEARGVFLCVRLKFGLHV